MTLAWLTAACTESWTSSQPASLLDFRHLLFGKGGLGQQVSRAHFTSANTTDRCYGARSSHRLQSIPTCGNWRISAERLDLLQTSGKNKNSGQTAAWKEKSGGCFIQTTLQCRHRDNSSLGNAINIYWAIKMDLSSPKKKKKALPIIKKKCLGTGYEEKQRITLPRVY